MPSKRSLVPPKDVRATLLSQGRFAPRMGPRPVPESSIISPGATAPGRKLAAFAISAAANVGLPEKSSLARNGGVITSTPPPPARNKLPEASSERLSLSSQVTQSRNVENRSVEPSAFTCARKASWQTSDVKKGGGLARQLAEYVEEKGAASGKSEEWVPPVTRTWPDRSRAIPVTVSWPGPPRNVE